MRGPSRLGTVQYLVGRGLAKTVWNTAPTAGVEAIGTAVFGRQRGTARTPGGGATGTPGGRHLGSGTAEFLSRRGLARAVAERERPEQGTRTMRAREPLVAEEGAVDDPCGHGRPGHGGSIAAGGTAAFRVNRGTARSLQVAAAPGGPHLALAWPVGAMGAGGGVPMRYDAHAHIICPTRKEWLAAQAGGRGGFAPSSFARRVDYLLSFQAAYSFEHMVISAWPQNMYEAGAMTRSSQLNEVTWAVYQQYPQYFIPFATISNADLTSTTATLRQTMEDQLAIGAFMGIGEIFVHAETVSLGRRYDDALFELCELAAERKLPIQFHWSIGHADNADIEFSAETNRQQLTRLLDRIVDEIDVPPTVILAHCGIGPGELADGSTYAYLTDWEDFLLDVLANSDYSFLMFDLAGMQSATNHQLLTSVPTLSRAGDVISRLIDGTNPNGVRYAHRFMFATDAQKVRSRANTAAFVPDYDDFLQLGGVAPTDRSLVRYGNAKRTF